jgi:hypothetical protein
MKVLCKHYEIPSMQCTEKTLENAYDFRLPKTVLFQIKAPHFCAGGEIKNRIIIKAAPIIKYMIGWKAEKLSDFCKRKKWDIKSHVVQNGIHDLALKKQHIVCFKTKILKYK